ncbi:hypothetical protein [Enterococcus faecalis]|uniref:hypothetical protein n=1 Tax=Enterococcus faecalis TaxID=1351 RepID=UPI00045B2DE5|nr:hypothetical protein [Enterococcus faecalis]KAJ62328.1 hypothetical protein P785_1374 [Enterococcus faecalis KS19]
MNQRQKKKRMTKALKILNQAEVIEFDCEGEEVLYIDIEDTPENVNLVNKACSILGLDKKKFIADCREDRQDEGTLDLSSGWFTLIRVEPKKFTIWYSLAKGFYLVRCLEEEQ